MKPAKPITDPTFRYTNAASTDLRKTFARIRRELAERAKVQSEAEIEQARVVRTLRKAGK
jgi:hypothetical protein